MDPDQGETIDLDPSLADVNLTTAVGVGAVTAPWWLSLIWTGGHWYFFLGGAALLTHRLYHTFWPRRTRDK